MAAKISPHIRVITLDTGRLPEETYEMMEICASRYGIQVGNRLTCRKRSGSYGEAPWSESVLRVGCHAGHFAATFARFVRWRRSSRNFGPGLWACGRTQSETREASRKWKRSGWTGETKARWRTGRRKQVEEYIRANDVPRHPLYAKGYTSIGCGPCTRALRRVKTNGRRWLVGTIRKQGMRNPLHAGRKNRTHGGRADSGNPAAIAGLH